jgi:hypothetical protein
MSLQQRPSISRHTEEELFELTLSNTELVVHYSLSQMHSLRQQAVDSGRGGVDAYVNSAPFHFAGCKWCEFFFENFEINSTQLRTLFDIFFPVSLFSFFFVTVFLLRHIVVSSDFS